MQAFKTPKRRQQPRGQATSRKVLSAAEELLTREGLSATIVSRISEVSGVSIGSVYHHFGSKEGILVSLIDEFCHRAKNEIDAADIASKSPKEALRDVIETTVRQFRENPELYRATAEQISQHPEVWQPMRELRQYYEDLLFPVLREELLAVGVGNPEIAVAKMMQTVLALLTHIVIFDSKPIGNSQIDTVESILPIAYSVLRLRANA